VAGASSIGCGGCILEVAGAIIAVVAWIGIEFKGLCYEVWVEVLVGSIILQECTGGGNGHLCLFPSLFVE